MLSLTGCRGFTLVEALVAALIASTGLAGLAQLAAVATRQATAARRTATALALAQSQLEYLRAEAWTYDAAGAPVSSSVLSVSPASALTTDAPGFFDELDRFGAVVADGASAHYRRRWAVSAFEPGDPDTLLLRVCVFARGHDAGNARAEACVWGIRTRKP